MAYNAAMTAVRARNFIARDFIYAKSLLFTIIYVDARNNAIYAKYTGNAMKKLLPPGMAPPMPKKPPKFIDVLNRNLPSFSRDKSVAGKFILINIPSMVGSTLFLVTAPRAKANKE